MKVDVKILDISPTEEFIMNNTFLDDDMKDWRSYRIEYGGCNEECLCEGRIFLPPHADPQVICNIIMGMQAYGEMWTTVEGMSTQGRNLESINEQLCEKGLTSNK